MDAQFYRDTKPTTFTIADESAVTLSTTSLMLWPIARTSLVANYFYPGKKVKLTWFGKITTAATPGNLTIEIRLGTTDNGGTILATSAATALAASKTNISCTLEAYVHCRAIGSSGSLFAWGKFIYDGAAALFTTTSQNPLLIPASAPAATTVDLTAATGLNIQMKRSGSTAESVTTQEVIYEALN